MQEHEKRVVEDRAELNEKLSKLEAFLASDFRQKLDHTDQSLLVEQAKIMTDYVLTLDARIERFTQ